MSALLPVQGGLAARAAAPKAAGPARHARPAAAATPARRVAVKGERGGKGGAV